MATRFSGWQRGAAAVPLVLVSLAWPATLTAWDTPRADPGAQDPALPELSSALAEPASATSPGAPATLTVRAADAGSVTRTDRPTDLLADDTTAIPAVALAAYQFAEAVMRTADPSCELSWPLLAAIGRVESDHGRHAGAALDADGLAAPGIVGIRLDGRRGTTRIADTDSGRLDGDTRFDRAVGPMQFIPSTWSVVGVDGDHDGTRDPQDVDDAALASAVYLCAGEESLADRDGLRGAVHRYNRSQAYVDLVVSVARDYAGLDLGSADGARAWRALGPVSSGLPTAAVDERPAAATEPRRVGELSSVPGRLSLVSVGPPASWKTRTPKVPTPAPPPQAPPREPTPPAPTPSPTPVPTPEPPTPEPTPTPTPEPTPEEPTPAPPEPAPTPPAPEPTPTPPAPEPTPPGPTQPGPTPPGPTTPPGTPEPPEVPAWVWQVDWPAGWTPAEATAALPELEGEPLTLEDDELPVLVGAPEGEAFTEVLTHAVTLCLEDPEVLDLAVRAGAVPDGDPQDWAGAESAGPDGSGLDRAALYGLEEVQGCVLEWLRLSDAGAEQPR